MPQRNYRLEGVIREAARAAGALETALDDFVLDHQVYRFTTEDELPGWIEKCRGEYPHRFALQTDHDAELCRAAFIAKNKTAEGRLYTAVGEQRYEELKAMYANGLPESEKKRLNGSANHAKNPWSRAEGNVDAVGRYTPDAINRQMKLLRAIGMEKGAAIAAAVGAVVGQVRAPK